MKNLNTLRRRWVLVLLLAISVVSLGGCAESADPGGTNGDGAGTPPDATQAMTLDSVTQWADSGHAQVITFAATRDGCKNCHDGLTFTETGGGMQARVAEATVLDPPRDFAVSVDCRACHMGAGAAIADRGTVDQIPSIETAEGGLGAVCMACHNGWHPSGKNADGEFTAPHYSVQTDMLYGVNTVDTGLETAVTTVEKMSPHLKVQDTCVGCHGTGVDGFMHTFKVESFEGCESSGCHDTDMSQGVTAKADYDGDGTIENFTAEIEGLLETLKAAIEAKSGEFASEGGQVVFASGDAPDDATYAAAYNYIYVDKDGSKGAHNPAFTVDLLTRSIGAVK